MHPNGGPTKRGRHRLGNVGHAAAGHFRACEDLFAACCDINKIYVVQHILWPGRGGGLCAILRNINCATLLIRIVIYFLNNKKCMWEPHVFVEPGLAGFNSDPATDERLIGYRCPSRGVVLRRSVTYTAVVGRFRYCAGQCGCASVNFVSHLIVALFGIAIFFSLKFFSLVVWSVAFSSHRCIVPLLRYSQVYTHPLCPVTDRRSIQHASKDITTEDPEATALKIKRMDHTVLLSLQSIPMWPLIFLTWRRPLRFQSLLQSQSVCFPDLRSEYAYTSLLSIAWSKY